MASDVSKIAKIIWKIWLIYASTGARLEYLQGDEDACPKYLPHDYAVI
jgi:hypothetical protein